MKCVFVRVQSTETKIRWVFFNLESVGGNLQPHH